MQLTLRLLTAFAGLALLAWIGIPGPWWFLRGGGIIVESWADHALVCTAKGWHFSIVICPGEKWNAEGWSSNEDLRCTDETISECATPGREIPTS